MYACGFIPEFVVLLFYLLILLLMREIQIGELFTLGWLMVVSKCVIFADSIFPVPAVGLYQKGRGFIATYLLAIIIGMLYQFGFFQITLF
jgi:hypothetical protein